MRIQAKRILSVLSIVVGLGISAGSEAALYDRGSGLIYDDALNVTWLQDINYARTSGYDFDGKMNWNKAMTWVNSLSFHDDVRNIDYTDWRLPGFRDGLVCLSSVNCVNSELGYMFYSNFGGKAYTSLSSAKNIASLNLFKNVPTSSALSALWFDTLSGGSSYYAWALDIGNEFGGVQTERDTSLNFYAWAVRDGDVSTVPVPSVLWLFITGLIGISFPSIRRSND